MRPFWIEAAVPAIATVTSPTPCADCQFAKTSICRILGNGDPARIAAKRRRQLSLRPKRLLVREGEPSREVFRLHSGWGARFRVLANGDRQILSFNLPGDFLTPELLCGAPAQFSKVALTSMTLCAFPVEPTSDEVFGDPSKANFIERLLVRYVREADERVMMLGRMSAAGRIAGLILNIHKRLCRRGLVSGNAFDFPLRHEDIGDALGLTAAHVSRTLTTLRKAGLVDTHSGHAVVDREGLLKLTR